MNKNYQHFSSETSEQVKTHQIHPILQNVPYKLHGLIDLSYNLWWSWHPEARMIFKELDHLAWKKSIHNPVKMLKELPMEIFDRAINNPEYMNRYAVIMNRFKQCMAYKNGWFSENFEERKHLTIAYFSAEYGIHHSLPFYAGGLGILSGDYLKECSDLGVPIVAVGFMYSKGYLHQHIRADGWQENIEKILDRDTAPVERVLDKYGKQLILEVPHITSSIYIAVWKVQLGRVPIYLIDTDIEQNSKENRSISSVLYIEDNEQRLKQQIVLGIGGRFILNHLGIDYTAVHLNEGHSAFVLIERVRERMENGIDYETALRQVKETSFFTTHTPIAAGHDVFPFYLIDKYFSDYYKALGIKKSEFLKLGTHPEQPNKGFDMTVLAMRMTEYHNGVSKKHGAVARKMWNCLWPALPEENVPIDAITNGVHLPSWLNHRIKLLFDKYLNPVCGDWQKEHDNPIIWNLVDRIPDEELWNTKKWLKSKMISRIREKSQLKWAEKRTKPASLASEGVFLNQDILTIGFARRFTAYKRGDLIFNDLNRIKKIINNPTRPVQFIFAGKAHPADNEGKMILQRVYNFAQDPDFGGRIAFVEEYGSRVAQYLIHGVDVWLNNPIIPREASGTSGMKAALNGGLNLSALDGWWIEGYNGKNGWAFGNEFVDDRNRDKLDANSIYDIIENKIAPLYYSTEMNSIPHEWVKMMKESIKSIAPRFCTRRMVKEYMFKYYPQVLMHAKKQTSK